MGRRSWWRWLLNVPRLPVSLWGDLARAVAGLRVADPIGRAARRTVPPCSSPPFLEFVRGFRVFAKRETPRGTLAFYTGACVPILGRRDRFYGYALVADGGRVTWGSWSRVGSAVWHVEGLAELRTVSGWAGRACDTSVYGLVAPVVDTLEATFVDGQTRRTTPTDGAFALTALGADRVLELRLLGGDGGLLARITPPEAPRD